MSATVSDRPALIVGLLRPTVAITLLTLAGQFLGFLTQIVIAAAFGARADMDAFLAASTLPQYVIAVLLSALGFVFIPVFIEHAAVGSREEAWDVANGVITACTLALTVICTGGIVLARPLLQWTTPGLSAQSLDLAVRVARITWPTIVLTGLASLLTSVYHAHSRFSWPALAPVLGSALNLGLVVMLARPWGVVGVAIAAAASLALQVALLAPIVRQGRYRPRLNWNDRGVRRVFHLLLPLVLAGLLTRWTPIVDRFLASHIAEGAISHLGYAFRLLGLLSLLISTGIATTIFPRMAVNTSASDFAGLRETLSTGLRLMWLAIAPVTVIGAVLALPVVLVVFQRGAFSARDAGVVAWLFRIYVLSLVSSCLSGLTSRTFYAMKDTRTVAVVGVFEALAYVFYTPLLARSFGASGIALGYVVYFDVSLLWQVLVIRFKVGGVGGRTLSGSFAKTAAAALLAGVPAIAATFVIVQPAGQILVGGTLALAVYFVTLRALGSIEIQALYDAWAARSGKLTCPE